MTKRSFVTKVLLGSILAFPILGFSADQLSHKGCAALFSFITAQSKLDIIHAFDAKYGPTAFYTKSKFLNSERGRKDYAQRIAVEDIAYERDYAEAKLDYLLENPADKDERKAFVEHIASADAKAYNTMILLQDLKAAIKDQTAKINYGVNDSEYVTISFKTRITEDPNAEVVISWKKDFITDGTAIEPVNAPVRTDFAESDMASFIKAQNDFYQNLPEDIRGQYQDLLAKKADQLFDQAYDERSSVEQLAAAAYEKYFKIQYDDGKDASLSPEEKLLNAIFGGGTRKQFYKVNTAEQSKDDLTKVNGYISRIIEADTKIDEVAQRIAQGEAANLTDQERIIQKGLEKHLAASKAIDKFVYGISSPAEQRSTRADLDDRSKHWAMQIMQLLLGEDFSSAW